MLGTSPGAPLASLPPKPMPLVTSPSIPLTERLVGHAVRRGEINVAGEAQRLWRPQIPTHLGVLPCDRQRSLVSDLVERPDHRLEMAEGPRRSYQPHALTALPSMTMLAAMAAPVAPSMATFSFGAQRRAVQVLRSSPGVVLQSRSSEEPAACRRRYSPYQAMRSSARAAARGDGSTTGA